MVRFTYFGNGEFRHWEPTDDIDDDEIHDIIKKTNESGVRVEAAGPTCCGIIRFLFDHRVGYVVTITDRLQMPIMYVRIADQRLWPDFYFKYLIPAMQAHALVALSDTLFSMLSEPNLED